MAGESAKQPKPSSFVVDHDDKDPSHDLAHAVQRTSHADVHDIHEHPGSIAGLI